MTTWLDYPGQPPRAETDAEVIATLLRKGWTARPPMPEHDPATHAARWDGAQWVVEPLPPPPVPEQVAAHHFRRALRALGLRPAVDALLAQLPPDHEIREDFDTAPFFRRGAAGIESVRVALGLTHAQVDELFRVADQVRT